MIARHTLTILAVADLPRASKFYDAVFGWKVSVDVPVYRELELPGGNRLGLYARDAFAKNTGQLPGIAPGTTATELYFQVDDLAAFVARLRRSGARELSAPAPRDWGDTCAYFADPDGNVLVVAAPTPAT